MNKPTKYERPIIRKLSMVTQSSTGGKLGRGLFPFQLHDPQALGRFSPPNLPDLASTTLKTQSDSSGDQQPQA